MNKWILGARPRTLPAAIAPVAVATALAGSDASLLPALLALFVALALQIGVNYANDYSDGIRGTDNDRVGPIRLTASGLATAQSVKHAAFIAFGVAAVAGLALAAMTSWWLIAVGAAAILAAWGYTGGKNPYGYIGLGELFVFIFFGLVATVGTYFVQVEEITLASILIAIPMGTFSCALLAINNIRDRALDAPAGKKTLAVRLGDRKARYFFATLIALGYLATLALFNPWTLLTLLTAPIAVALVRGVLGDAQGAALIPYLAKTGKLQLQFSILLSLALVLSHG
ncbi:MAG: 1,4-dihydroxy-2-naphthoate polyprenyltransferase [Candidatus Planktophila sp.]|nr:1,4-dihydroxy-2-naphthoate polyprenyltransferase [Candidatus Planktophila sp.]MBP7902891.1 1,4-dihydroxy-2-naphthoate polyprenyltransferase [Candidatus Planktophila sp.]